jgi:hypothetical protein
MKSSVTIDGIVLTREQVEKAWGELSKPELNPPYYRSQERGNVYLRLEVAEVRSQLENVEHRNDAHLVVTNDGTVGWNYNQSSHFPRIPATLKEFAEWPSSSPS